MDWGDELEELNDHSIQTPALRRWWLVTKRRVWDEDAWWVLNEKEGLASEALNVVEIFQTIVLDVYIWNSGSRGRN